MGGIDRVTERYEREKRTRETTVKIETRWFTRFMFTDNNYFNESFKKRVQNKYKKITN